MDSRAFAGSFCQLHGTSQRLGVKGGREELAAMCEEGWACPRLHKGCHCRSGGGQCRSMEMPEAEGMCIDLAAAAVMLL